MTSCFMTSCGLLLIPGMEVGVADCEFSLCSPKRSQWCEGGRYKKQNTAVTPGSGQCLDGNTFMNFYTYLHRWYIIKLHVWLFKVFCNVFIILFLSMWLKCNIKWISSELVDVQSPHKYGQHILHHQEKAGAVFQKVCMKFAGCVFMDGSSEGGHYRPLRPELRSAPADWSLWSKALADSCIRGRWRKLWLMRRHLRDRNVYMHRWPLIYRLQWWCNSYSISSLCRFTSTEKFLTLFSLKFIFCGNN